MYYIVGILITFLCILLPLHCRRKKRILKKLARMSPCEKYSLLDSVVKSFGYKYIPEWDVFSSRVDAWQRQFGYGTVYDRASVYFNMALHTLPIYFDYEGRTWLIQVWKGQYGICTGCELGLYHANGLVDESRRKDAIFQAVDNDEMMDLSAELWRQGIRIASLNQRHWWLTAFDVGTFSRPSELSLDISIRFPNHEMKDAFYFSLLKQGVNRRDIFSYHTSIYFHMPDCRYKTSLWRRLHTGLVQGINHFNCNLFCFVTRCCYSSCDRILYLYFYLPLICRHLLRLRHFPRKKKRGWMP